MLKDILYWKIKFNEKVLRQASLLARQMNRQCSTILALLVIILRENMYPFNQVDRTAIKCNAKSKCKKIKMV